MENNKQINIKKCYFHSLKKDDNDLYLNLLYEDDYDNKDDDMEYLSLSFMSIKFIKVTDLKITGSEADNYKYLEGDIDYQNKKVHLKYLGMNFIGNENEYEFSFSYDSYIIDNISKIESVDC